MSFDRFPRTQELLRQAVRDEVAPGFVAGLWSPRAPGSYFFHAEGVRRLKGKGLPEQPMEVDTVFDLASVTKVFGTATLAAHLVDRGWLKFESRLRSFFPEFRSDDVTIGHLLSHTSGLPAWVSLYEKLKEKFGTDELPLSAVADRQKAMRDLVIAVEPERGAGQKAVYSDIGFLLLGFVLEEVLSLPLDQAISRHLWEPMGLMRESGPHPYFQRVTTPAFRFRNDRVAATEDCPWRNTVLQGQVHDDNCWAMGGYGGHAGAFGTVKNLLDFSKSLHGRFLSQEVRERMWTRVAHPSECDRTLGWDTPSGDLPTFGNRFSRNSVGHLGFTGTSLWIDRENAWTVVLLSNRVHPSRANEKLKPFRARFHDSLAQELGL